MIHFLFDRKNLDVCFFLGVVLMDFAELKEIRQNWEEKLSFREDEHPWTSQEGANFFNIHLQTSLGKLALKFSLKNFTLNGFFEEIPLKIALITLKIDLKWKSSIEKI